MYREDYPPATLVPVPRMSDTPWGEPTLVHHLGHDGPDANIAAPAPRRGGVVEHGLAFRVRLVCSETQLLRVQALRQTAYGRHLPEQAAAFGSADPQDRAAGTVIFYAEDKATGRVVGSARIQSNRHVPLQIEGSIELPAAQRGRQLAEITRLCVLPGYDHKVRLALVKACHLYCIAMQIGGVVAGSRRSLVRLYESLGFTDLYGDERMCALRHAGGLPHRVLFRDTVTSESMARERQHPDHAFVFRDFHPDIEVFEALGAAVSFGLAGHAAQNWPLAA